MPARTPSDHRQIPAELAFRPLGWLLTGGILGVVTAAEIVPRALGFSPADRASETGVVVHTAWWQRPLQEVAACSIGGGLVLMVFVFLAFRSWREADR
jgi:hypothetical protein